jgi:protein-S-isoprenylcysteine O-methyltransferase Ste14
VRTPAAALGSAAFFLAAPCVVAGAVPWSLTGWHTAQPRPPAVLAIAGAALIVAGVAVVVQAFARFVREGHGTPAPVAPTERLVVGGLYCYVRNPIYLAVAATIVGQALVLVVWAAAFGVVVFAFVRLYEEPVLARRYGDQYDSYRRAVPGWWPRLRRR